MAFTAKDVQALREKTGCGMMDCKKALVETDGDMDAAVELLREKGLASAAKKATRVAAEGIVATCSDDKAGVLVELNCETDFVAKGAPFIELSAKVAKTVLAAKPADVEALLATKAVDSDRTIEEEVQEVFLALRENMKVRRFAVVEGHTATYIHAGGSVGVIVAFDTDDATAEKAEFVECAKNVALQIAAGSPPTYVAKENVPQNAIDEEIAIQVAAAKNDPKLASKPDAVLAKIVEGKLGKLFFEKVCLLEQPFVKDDSMSVGKYVAACAKTLGAEIAVKAFYIFEKGEGIEKREDDFAAEIEKMVKG